MSRKFTQRLDHLTFIHCGHYVCERFAKIQKPTLVNAHLLRKQCRRRQKELALPATSVIHIVQHYLILPPAVHLLLAARSLTPSSSLPVFPPDIMSAMDGNKYGGTATHNYGGEEGMEDFGLNNMNAFDNKSIRLAFIR